MTLLKNPPAMKTCQSQVAESIRSAVSERDDVINSESNILPLFGSVAVFAGTVRSLTDSLLKGGRYFATRGQPLPILLSLGLNQVPDHTVQKAQVIVYLFVAV